MTTYDAIRKSDHPWIAQIFFNGKNKRLGYFATEKEVALAYDEAARQYHKDKAITNFDLAGNRILMNGKGG